MSCISVLIVDDDKDFAASLYDIAELEGYTVHIAHTIIEAQRLCRTYSFHSAFIDIKLDDKDGTSLALYLSDRYPDIRICMMTGYTNETIESDYSVPEKYQILYKPIKIDTFINVLAQR